MDSIPSPPKPPKARKIQNSKSRYRVVTNGDWYEIEKKGIIFWSRVKPYIRSAYQPINWSLYRFKTVIDAIQRIEELEEKPKKWKVVHGLSIKRTDLQQERITEEANYIELLKEQEEGFNLFKSVLPNEVRDFQDKVLNRLKGRYKEGKRIGSDRMIEKSIYDLGILNDLLSFYKNPM